MTTSWRILASAVTMAAASAVCAGQAGAVTISVFDNPSYVDTVGGPTSESETIQVTLASLGHTVNTFTGISAAEFAAAGAAADLMLFPEIERGDLNAALDDAAREAITDYVSGGGAVIVMGSDLIYDKTFLNGVFGYSLTGTVFFETYRLDATAASGTPFAGGPAALSWNDVIGVIDRSTLPAGALDLYHGENVNAVFAAPFGDGIVIRLGWDWFRALPLGDRDGGWIGVLDTAVNYAASYGDPQPVSEPASLALIGAGLAGLVMLRRQRASARRAAA
jgi:hypothetical protein